ncbi:MAG: hypothetical protein IJJ26_13670 [Victivallales bacterium]|nr:hypothetical protein [Victivallales bacterium]
MLTADFIKQKAREFGADAVGIGDISNFYGAPQQRDPRQILPDATCVIGCAFRIPRELYRVMHNQKQFYNYTMLGPKYIDEDFAEIFLLKMAGIIEDEGYDACVQRNIVNLRIQGDHSTNPEITDTYELKYAEAIAPDKPVPDVILDFGMAARACGLGAPGMSGHILVPKFGPFVRFVFIVTDAPLACDPPFTGSLCDRCGKCQGACPGHAISERGEDTWQCAVYYRGAARSNPFMTDDFLKDNPERDAILDGKKRFDRESARAIYPKLDFLPSRPTGYVPCLCGRACDNACFEHLKEAGRL